MTSETIFELDGQRLSYEIHGQGVPVVTLTNLAASPDVWPLPYARRLTDAGYRVVAIQHLGPADTRDQIVSDMGALIEHLDIAPVHLWGYSQGAMFAQELALARPDLVRSAVMMATIGRKRAFDRVVADFYEELWTARESAPELAKAADTFMGLLSFSPATLAVDAFVDVMVQFMSGSEGPAWPEEAMERSRAMWMNYDNRLAALGGVRVLCLVIGFEIDLLTLAAGGREVADAITGARYVEIAGAAHSGIATHTDEVFEHVLAFFAEVSADEADPRSHKPFQRLTISQVGARVKTMIEVDTLAGRQASWRLEHMAAGDRVLTPDEVVAHFDPQMLGGITPEEFIETQRWFSKRFSELPLGVVGSRAESPYAVEVTLAGDDGYEWRWTLRVSEEAPNRIVEIQMAAADLAPPEDAGPDRPLVNCVDHFFVALAEPKPALDLFTERLGLPLAWPWVPNADGTGNAAVELGNAQLELLNFNMYEAFKPHTPARVQGIALEPPPISDSFIAEIDRRGLPHAPPLPTGIFTNIFFGGLIKDPVAVVFVCRYHHPSIRDRVARRAVLDECGGGELGVTGVVELVIGSSRPEELVERWQSLLDPIAQVGPGYWRIGEGPAIRIVEDAEDAVREIMLGVRSLEHAVARVRELDVGTAEPTGDGVLVDLEQLNGLRFHLVRA